jgi:hypothetical protein
MNYHINKIKINRRIMLARTVHMARFASRFTAFKHLSRMQYSFKPIVFSQARPFSTTENIFPDPIRIWKPLYDHSPEELSLMLENEFFELLTRHMEA